MTATTTRTAPPTVAPERSHAVAELFIRFMETGNAPDGLLAPDVICDLTVPTWRLQAAGAEDLVALRRAGHPAQGRVPRWRFDPTPTGFVLEFEEEWEQDGGTWYCRELARADVTDAGITELSISCTGDWSPQQRTHHTESVPLIRP